ncbi:unnamed protein product [Rotaria sp. Silwood1]|nr:unnamed protein product [Rotaria sp. Silwood1]CAF1676358.1 unnamed protein product [Rotaria sp. Silwood1]
MTAATGDQKKQYVLVPGDAGFIGSHCVIELITAGYAPIIVDNEHNSSAECLKRVERITGCQIINYKIDCLDIENLRNIFKKYLIYAIINCAALKSVGESVQKPILYYKNNIGCLLNLLTCMEEFNVKNFLFSSSATVYGTPKYLPLDEKHPCIGDAITNPYGKSLIGEDPIGKRNNLMPYIAQVAVGRLPYVNIFGTDYDTSDGTGVREYIHVVDVAIGHIAAMKQFEMNCGLKIYNLGTGKGYSVLEMIKALEKVSGKIISYKECSRRPGDLATNAHYGYYDDTVFHRVVPNFIAQAGDPTGTGEGRESATGEFFADEFHTRVRFNCRVLVGMVNQGPNTNASQFFFTLDSTPELDKKNTLFGKVVGNTLFKMLKLGEGEIIGEIPVHKHKIIKAEILSNPFDNMISRPQAKSQMIDDDNDEINKKSKETVQAKAIKNYGLLSFGNEAEEEITKISMTFKQKGTGKSAHDLTNDSTLSKNTVVLNENNEESDADFDKEELDRVRQKFNAKKLAQQEKKKTLQLDIDDDDDNQKEFHQQNPAPSSIQPVTSSTTTLMDELMAERFRVKVHTAKDEQTSEPLNETQSKQIADKVQTPFLKHTFVSQELLDNVQDIYTNAELLTVYDPKNPMTKRRRDESSMLLHQKKHKGHT